MTALFSQPGDFSQAGDGPPGEIFGSALAHAETNVLARLLELLS